MAIVGSAEVLIRAIDTGFEAELKSKVGAAVDKTAAATKGVGVRVDGKALEKDLAAAETQYKGFFSRLFSAKPATIPVAIDGEKAEKAAAGIVTQLRQVTGAVGGLPGAEKVETITAGLLRMEAASKTSALALAGLAPIILAVVGAAVLLKGAAEFSSLAAQVRNVQLSMGGTAEEASKVIAISKVLGLNADSLAQAFFKFSINLGTNADKLKEFGVEAVHTTKGNTDVYASLLRLSDAYRSTADASQKALLVRTAFGRGGADLQKVLDQGGEGLKRLADEAERTGNVLGQTGEDKGVAFGNTMRSAGEAVKGLSVQLGGPVVGLLSGLAGAVTSAITAIDKLHPGAASILIQYGVAVVVVSKAVDFLAARLGVAAVETGTLAVAEVEAGASATGAAVGTEAWIVALEELAAAETVAKAGAISMAAAALAAFATSTAGIVAMAAAAHHAAQGQLKDINDLAVKAENEKGIKGFIDRALTAGTNTDKLAASSKDGAKALDDHALAANGDADAIQRIADAATEAANKQAAAFASLPDVIASVDKARAAAAALATDPNANVEAAQRSLEDAQQKVIDLTDQAKAAKVAYAEKVTSANRAVIDSERSLADTIKAADQRIGDDEKSLAKAQLDAVKSVADAKAAAAKADLDAHDTLRSAERALSDERARQNAGGNAALLRQLQGAQSINSATAAVDKARADAAATAAKGAESVTKAQTDGLDKVASAQQSLDRDRVDSARQIEAAERSVADAKTAQNKVALEAIDVAKKAALAERDIVRAVEAVGAAQKAVADAAKKDAEAAVAVEKAVIDALVNEQVARDAAVGIIDDETRKLEIRKQIIADTLKGLDPAGPQGQFVLGLGLIISGLAHDFGDAAAKAVTLTSELAGLNGQLDGLTGDANANGPGGGRGAALNQVSGRIADLKRLLGLAAGGPAMAGESYWVGESGIERLDMFRGGGGFVTPLSGNAPRTPTPVGSDGASHGPLIGQLVVQGATVAASYATGVEVARAVRAREYARSGR